MILPKTKTSALILPILTIAMSFFITNTTYAAGNTQDNIVKKSYLQGLGLCYDLKNGGTEDDYKEGWWLFQSNVRDDNGESMGPNDHQLAGEVKTSTYENDFSYKKLFPMEPAKEKIRLPNGWTPENGDSKTNCAHLVNGHNDGFTDTIYDRFNKPEAKVQGGSSADNIKKFMENMGYKKESSSIKNGKKCFTITYDWQKYKIIDIESNWQQLSNEKGSDTSSVVCAHIENGIVTNLSYPNDVMDAKYLSLGINYNGYSNGGAQIDFIVVYDPENFNSNCPGNDGMNCYPFGRTLDDGGQEGLAHLPIYDKNYSWDQFYDELEKRVNALKGGKDNFSNAYNGGDFKYAIGLTGKSINVTDSQATDVVWKLNGSRATARDKAISYLNTGNNIGSSYSKLGLTESQAVVLYQHYIKDIAQATVNCNLDSPSSTDVAVKWFESATERKDCYITGYNADETEYNIVDDKGYFTLGVKFSKLVDTLNAMTIDKLDGVDDAIESSQSTIGQNQEDPISDSDEEVTCYTAGGSLGWILCPILEFTTDAVSTLYDSVIEPYLAMDASLFTEGSGDKTFEAWQTFQSIANICFVILFIIVIFSQITGVGIDNYGIKKILPKLITAALLINLSYIICEIAIDISNIVGSGIKSIFDGLISDVSISEITVENGTKASFGATAITGGAALLAVIVGAVALYTNGAAILIPLFIAAISVLVSIFFLFVLLSLRKAAVIILVVVSPLALGCYMLPNTKKFFDKWFKALKGMLLLYPIAGALVGGGNYVSKILLSTGNGTADFFFALSAMIIGVVPIFFIPGLLKSSFAAIGNIGTKLSGLSNKYGGKLKNYTRNGLENTRLTDGRNYRRMMKADARKARTGAYNVGQARKTVDRLGQKKIGAMSARERSQLRAAQSVVDSENKSMRDLYASRFNEISDPEAIGDELLAVGGEDKFDVNMATAAIEKMGSANQKVMLDKLGEFSKTKAWKNMSDSDRAKIADTLAAQKGNVVAKSYAKTLRTDNVSLEQALQGGVQENASGNQVPITSIGERINQMGASALTDTDKDVFEYIATQEYNDANGNKQNLINSFNSEQVGHAISHLDGQSKEGKGFQAAIQKRTDLAGDISSMSVEDFASSKYANLAGRTSDDGVREAIKTQVNKAVKNDNVKDKLDAGYIQYIDKGSNTNNTSPNGANT